MEGEGQQSLECVPANQIAPKDSPVPAEDNMQVPFVELHGETAKFVEQAEDGVIAASNYRLHIKFKESLVNVPLQLIECAECRDMFQLHITCKDCKVIRCQFSTFEQCQEWLKRLNALARPPSHLEDLFSFAFHESCMNVYASEKEQHGELCRPGEHVTSWFKNEVERMGFDTQNAWRTTDINSKFRLCSSYPQQLLVPAWITDKELENVAAFRSWKRIPAVVYRHQSSGAVIARCGQPEVSWWGWRNADDEHLVQSIAKACAVDGTCRKPVSNGNHSGPELADTDFESSLSHSSEAESLAIQPHTLLILDARSYAAAVANRAKGGGCECPDYYPNCEVVFMGMANIHSIRKSFQSLRFLCTQIPDPANWLSALESTKWLQHLSLLLKAALLVVHAVDRDHRPVLVHCSDGWDRTPQIVALAKLLLDPYYRTVEGFQVLVETEWLDFGHKFADRCGHGENSEDLNERCPVFLQWLDCVHQLQRQFPCSFEFNEAFLVKLVQHTYSCLFGTFLCNSGKEREDRRVQERTCSVWSLLRPAHRSLRNMLYSSHSENVLHPVCHVRNLMLWTAVYLPSSSPTTPSDDSCAPYPVPGGNPEDTPLSRCTKTRSYDNLPSACEMGGSLPANRRSSDPSLNDKWQDHRRSLDINMAAAPDGGGNQEQEAWPNGGGEDPQADGGGDSESDDGPPPRDSQAEPRRVCCVSQAEVQEVEEEEEEQQEEEEEEEQEEEALSVVGGATGQARKMVQEATSEEAAASADAPSEGGASCALLSTTVDTPGATEDAVEEEEEEEPLSPSVNGTPTRREDLINGHDSEEPEEPEDGEPALPGSSQQGEPEPSASQDEETTSPTENSSVQEEALPPPPCGPCESKRRTLLTNGFADSVLEAAPPLESSTETLTEDGCGRSELRPARRPRPQRGEGPQQTGENGCGGRTLNGLAAFQRPAHACNGERGPADAAPPRRQAAGGSSYGHAPRAVCSLHRCCHAAGRPAVSPDQPGRGHLDDDGLTLHTDAVQQRLRQIEAGHQMEVETLKKQLQELWSRLENQQYGAARRLNGDMGGELTSMTDSEFHLDPNCLSRCSTELFCEASWEQVDKQDTEVTRWFPDHLAAQCYGCESRFWLATRKHHCRNCGNVFCSSCCDQKIPVPSQQLFEPSRVCRSCYSNLQIGPAPLELDKPITASSN
ncbi:phosphatidylinositol-3,5-bisphosphate 3-phosphatase MTMR3 isoform X3 [Nelusetta ayraudi]|uniref:phosphatidylinositol-3,5-bisphosphate 3-phosphatase MTMR3 isoform X3 n=1 Tax=Nelusetta ayraudi TaxID=303726 RepID=UPI003F70DEEE